MTATTKTRTRRPAAKAEAPVPAPVPAPAKKSHRQLVADAMAAWQHENQTALTLVAHLAGTATAGSTWRVRLDSGEERRARFDPTTGGNLRLAGFEDKAPSGKSTRNLVAAEVAKLGQYEVVLHSTGSVWTVKDAAGKLYSFDRKAGTLTEKPGEKDPAPAEAK